VKHKARKRFGQNFLTDTTVVQRIVNSIAPRPDQVLIEIGPGQAALSVPLADTGAELHLLELDRDLAGNLEKMFRNNPRVHLHIGDALKTDFAELSGGRTFRLVGNLPYNISTPLLFHVLQWHDLIIDMHFMLQLEVVKRMAAGPGSKTWGRLSIMCQFRCQVESLFQVPAESFSPIPKVQSAIVRLIPHAEPPVLIESLDTFERLVSQIFSMRRKTLRNSLRGMLSSSQIESIGVDPGLRPEAISLQQFAELSRLVE